MPVEIRVLYCFDYKKSMKTAAALVEFALEHVAILKAKNFFDIKISLKVHDVPLTLVAYRLMSVKKNYPLHLGITVAGTVNTGVIKSAVGIGVKSLGLIAAKVEEKISAIKQPLTVAVMGCVVNGPGEARTADVGIAGADGEGIIFRKGVIVRKVPEPELVAELFKEIDAILNAE